MSKKEEDVHHCITHGGGQSCSLRETAPTVITAITTGEGMGTRLLVAVA
jgi:hypothetical protein